MNEAELAENKQLTSYDVHDLNVTPTLPYEDEAFDVSITPQAIYRCV